MEVGVGTVAGLTLLLPLTGNLQLNFHSPLDEPAEYKNRGDLESDIGIRKACRFPRSVLGPCSGVEDRDFGYREGKPCVIVKLNRIVNFRPRVI